MLLEEKLRTLTAKRHETEQKPPQQRGSASYGYMLILFLRIEI